MGQSKPDKQLAQSGQKTKEQKNKGTKKQVHALKRQSHYLQHISE
jgi:hypothetical protein